MKLDNNAGGSIPLILFLLGLIASGGLYTLAFIIILPSLYGLIPNSVFKTVIIYGIIYFAPIVVIFVGIIALIQSGLKEHPSWRGG